MRKWKCVETDEEQFWTVGKIYETDESGNGLVSDNGESDWCAPLQLKKGFYGYAKFEEVTPFTKADLKPCMVAELRDGRIAMAIQCSDNEITFNLLSDLDYGLISLDLMSEDLLSSGFDNRYDIMKVFDFSNGNDVLSIKSRKLLFERIEKSPTQLKLEELENKQREIADEIKKIREEME